MPGVPPFNQNAILYSVMGTVAIGAAAVVAITIYGTPHETTAPLIQIAAIIVPTLTALIAALKSYQAAESSKSNAQQIVEVKRDMKDVRDIAVETQEATVEASKKLDRAIKVSQPKHPRILIVDDDQAFRNLLRDELNLKGFNASAVATGEAAIETLKKESADIVVLDFMLPGMSGEEVVRRINGAHSRTPIVMITGFPEAIRQEVQQKIAGVVLKPVVLEELYATLEHALHRVNPLPEGH